MVQRLWKRYSPFFHLVFLIISMSFTAGIVWAGVAGQDGRISTLEDKQEKSEKRQIRMDGNLELLMRAVGVKPLPPVEHSED